MKLFSLVFIFGLFTNNFAQAEIKRRPIVYSASSGYGFFETINTEKNIFSFQRCNIHIVGTDDKSKQLVLDNCGGISISDETSARPVLWFPLDQSVVEAMDQRFVNLLNGILVGDRLYYEITNIFWASLLRAGASGVGAYKGWKWFYNRPFIGGLAGGLAAGTLAWLASKIWLNKYFNADDSIPKSLEYSLRQTQGYKDLEPSTQSQFIDSIMRVIGKTLDTTTQSISLELSIPKTI